MSRQYFQLCGIAAALDQVGERWTLLLVRDLLPGGLTFSELLQLEKGLAPNLLSKRLNELSARGLVRREGTGKGARYELTERGQALQPVLFALGDFGMALLRAPDSRARFDERWLMLSLTRLAGDSVGDGAIEVRLSTAVYEISAPDGVPRLRARAAERPDVVVTTTPGALVAMLRGTHLEALERRGADGSDALAVHVLGERERFLRFMATASRRAAQRMGR